MCVRYIEFTYIYDYSIECWNCSDSVIYIFSFYYRLWKKTSWVAIVKKKWLWSSSVIKIVKIKYNRIDIKWWRVSVSFKIYQDILVYLYITFTIFYYNTISLKWTLFTVLVKGLYQTESYSLHVMQLIHIWTIEEYFYFSHLVVWDRYCACEILIANPIGWLYSRHRMDNSLWFKRMELIDVKSLIWA